jgi:hypothetical protein
MPLDYNAATYPSSASAPAGDLAIDHSTVVAAVERYLASRGVAVPAASSGPTCSCQTKTAPAPSASPATSVVDAFLARRGGNSPSGGYG